MTTLELAKVVNDMRIAQREYFRTRSESALKQAKQLEVKVDRCLAHILTQPALFNED